MAFDFPSSPVADTVFTDTASGKSYQWDGTVWQGLGGGSTGGEDRYSQTEEPQIQRKNRRRQNGAPN